MAKRSSRPGRMTRVPVTAIGSGAKVTDLFPLPMWLFIPLRSIRWVFRHWYVTAILVSILVLMSNPELWEPLIISISSLPVFLIAYLALNNRHHGPLAIVRAARHLLRTKILWGRACEAAELTDGPRRPRLIGFRRPVRIANEQGTALDFTINLSRVSLTTNHLENNKDYIAATLNARRTRVFRVTPGIARLTIEWEKKLHKSAVANPQDQIHATQLPRAILDDDVLLELDTSLLVVGESGSGKSNLTWHILNQLNAYGVPQKLYVLDPKKVELAELVDSPNTIVYADGPAESDQVIIRFHADMMRKFEQMKQQKIRKVTLDHENPLHILFVDELLLCPMAKKGIESELGEVLTAGRAAGFIVIGNSQLGQVDALTRLRDLFPQRICMAVKSQDLTNAVLGPNAEARGARCTEITEKGVGYIYTDFTGSFQRFKAPFIEDVAVVAEGRVWHPPSKLSFRARRQQNTTYVYRLYDVYGVLLYVGIAKNPNDRINQHDDKPWYNQISMGRTVIKKYPSEEIAREEEQFAIENEKPIYNLVHNHKA